jgi:predicted TIM-barrel fold metal-dependent hydrolase
MRGDYQVFDTHTHLGTARHSGRQCSADEMLRHMDRHGVDRSLLIPFPVVEDYRAAHDLIAGALKLHPDRFAGAACLDPFLPLREFRDEVERCAGFGFSALKLQPQYHGLNPLSPRHEFFFEAAMDNDLAVVVHTGAGAPFALPSLYIVPARKFPEVTIVLGHAGGGIYAAEAIVAATVCPNICIELSSLMPHHVREVLAHVNSSRLMIGSDLPESIGAEIGKIIDLDAEAEAKHNILWRTALRVFDGVAE